MSNSASPVLTTPQVIKKRLEIQRQPPGQFLLFDDFWHRVSIVGVEAWHFVCDVEGSEIGDDANFVRSSFVPLEHGVQVLFRNSISLGRGQMTPDSEFS